MKLHLHKSWGTLIVTPCVSIGYDKALEGGYWISVSWLRWVVIAIWCTEEWND